MSDPNQLDSKWERRITLLMEETHRSREDCEAALSKTNGDMAAAIALLVGR